MAILRFEKEGSQFIIHTDGEICESPETIVQHDIFAHIVKRFVFRLHETNLPMFTEIKVNLIDPEEIARLTELLRLLLSAPIEEAVNKIKDCNVYLENRKTLHAFVEELYNYWRSYVRVMICHADDLPEEDREFLKGGFYETDEKFTSMVRRVYRNICKNITGYYPKVYRQIAAACEVGMVTVPSMWECPDAYKDIFSGIPFIRQVLLSPPLVLDPTMNKRSGRFRKVTENPLVNVSINRSKWLCYPARVGTVTVFVYFHQKFISLGASLANLFEIATDEQVAAGPDAVYMYGAPFEALSVYGHLPTIFFDDEKNGIIVGAVPREDRFGYFGYLKKMILTLHNSVMMKRGRMPFHGALVHIELKTGQKATVLLIGDTATGKSESLEAFRQLGGTRIRQLKIIADDMGSLDLDKKNRVIGYGTEIGAFIRLDDLEFGYAFGQMDRAIIMSPNKVNARVVLPITTLDEVLKGYPVDFILYANNFDVVDEDHHIIEKFDSAEAALQVFREGAAMSRGTTTTTGLTHSYFANIFGPPQYKELHEELAKKTFKAAFYSGVFIGQMRTRLGIQGYETEGPREAAKALLGMISEMA